nr:MAG TPA: hypothetical protein [Caudoviricetes sp.]
MTSKSLFFCQKPLYYKALRAFRPQSCFLNF